MKNTETLMARLISENFIKKNKRVTDFSKILRILVLSLIGTIFLAIILLLLVLLIKNVVALGIICLTIVALVILRKI